MLQYRSRARARNRVDGAGDMDISPKFEQESPVYEHKLVDRFN